MAHRDPLTVPVSGPGPGPTGRRRPIGCAVLAGTVIVTAAACAGGEPSRRGSAAPTGPTPPTPASAPPTSSAATAPATEVGSPTTTEAAPTTSITSITSLAPATSPTTAAVAPTTTVTTTTTTTAAPAPAWRVVDVADGDTLGLAGPDGVIEVRLIGINAPEDGECFADVASAALERLAVGGLTPVRDESDTDRFGRALRYLDRSDGVDVGAAMVDGGFAIARRYEPDVARAERYEALQAAAQAAGRGLWAPDACGPASVAPSLDVTIRYDADGDDNRNLNDEWVRFTNTGSSRVDLDGWQVADESASHRYTFRGLVLEPGAQVTLYTGCGADTAAQRYWCNDASAIWNNSGDTVFLRDPSGNTVIAETYAGR